MIYGFTGTREAPSPAQLRWLDYYLRTAVPGTLHHGCCVGADAIAHRMAILLDYDVVGHPPLRLEFADTEAIEKAVGSHVVTMCPPKGYHERDRDIVDACNILLALPKKTRAEGGGTWYTIEYAEAQGKPVLCCLPSGRVTHLGKWNMGDLD